MPLLLLLRLVRQVDELLDVLERDRDLRATRLMNPKSAVRRRVELSGFVTMQEMNGLQPILKFLHNPRKAVAVGAERKYIKAVIEEKINGLVLGDAFGTIVAVLVLAIGISGLQQLGGGFYAEPIFQGVSLILSVGPAGYAARRRREGRRT